MEFDWLIFPTPNLGWDGLENWFPDSWVIDLSLGKSLDEIVQILVASVLKFGLQDKLVQGGQYLFEFLSFSLMSERINQRSSWVNCEILSLWVGELNADGIIDGIEGEIIFWDFFLKFAQNGLVSLVTGELGNQILEVIGLSEETVVNQRQLI